MRSSSTVCLIIACFYLFASAVAAGCSSEKSTRPSSEVIVSSAPRTICQPQFDPNSSCEMDRCDVPLPCGSWDDQDCDGVFDVGDNFDNCTFFCNPNQENADGDYLGDACDPCVNDSGNDIDKDGVCGDLDNCPGVANAAQADADGDGFGDVCEVNQAAIDALDLRLDAIEASQATANQQLGAIRHDLLME
jgi:hypothetical protein